jgi:hypothetical protein
MLGDNDLSDRVGNWRILRPVPRTGSVRRNRGDHSQTVSLDGEDVTLDNHHALSDIASLWRHFFDSHIGL